MGACRGFGARHSAAMLALGALLAACSKDEAPPPAGTASAQVAPGELSAQLAAKVLARVGSRSITLGDYAAALERMDQFERLRYQTAERRKQLLDELIDTELLAREAERRGLDKLPETQELTRQLLREEVLRRQSHDLPKLEELPMAQLREYYDSHKSEFAEPERRRVGHIVLKDRQQAEKVLAQAIKASPEQWGQLVKSNSVAAASSDAPLELSGDLGLVSAPGQERGENVNVPEPLRAAVFQLQTVGDVYDKLVEHDGSWHVVRLMGLSAARDRSFTEAERTIRVHLLRQLVEKSEDELLDKLRASIPVSVNEAALAQVETPAKAP